MVQGYVVEIERLDDVGIPLSDPTRFARNLRLTARKDTTRCTLLSHIFCTVFVASLYA